MRRYIAPLLLLLSLSCTHSVLARERHPFLTACDIPLNMLLAPPPADESQQTQDELTEILKFQAGRTPETVARVQADAAKSVWRFADVIGPDFQAERMPEVAEFFQRVVDTGGAAIGPYKGLWKRPRPHMLSELVKPAVKLSSSGSYPSGHATDGMLLAIVLSNMVPEKRAAIMARGAEYANNRVVAGIHYRSDVESGKIAGAVIAARLMMRDDFNAAFEAAKARLREALALGAEPAAAMPQ